MLGKEQRENTIVMYIANCRLVLEMDEGAHNHYFLPYTRLHTIPGQPYASPHCNTPTCSAYCAATRWLARPCKPHIACKADIARNVSSASMQASVTSTRRFILGADTCFP